jgi:hypothetical protein
VNVASRIEGLTKDQKVELLVSDATRRLAGDRFEWTQVGALAVRGKSDPVLTFVPGERTAGWARARRRAGSDPSWLVEPEDEHDRTPWRRCEPIERGSLG